MSKWVNTEKFEDFRTERQEDKTADKQPMFGRKWPNPKMGDQNTPMEYHIRLLPDPDGEFYKKYHYHAFKSGEQFYYIACPKTYGMDNYCPWCAITQLLYQGSTADKKKAGDYKRMDRYVGNIFVVKDPRDANEQDAEKKSEGKTFLYEFPATVEGQIRKEVTDTENGWGYVIFDPEEGHNMILRVGAKKPDKNQKVWPDYSQTTFAKKASSIGDSEEDIEEIMGTCQSIAEYLENSMWSAERHEALLKSEMVWEDVERDFIKHFGATEPKEGGIDTSAKRPVEKDSKPDVEDPDKEAHSEKKADKKPAKTPAKKETASQSDQDLLDELNDL